MANWLGIAMNEQTVFDGKLRGVYNGDSKYDKSDGLKVKVKSDIREYKKKFVRAWWDGIRSLPQYREWLALPNDAIKVQGLGNIQARKPIER